MELTEHPAFRSSIVCLIIGNTFVLSLDRFPIEKKEENVLEILNYFFFSCFALEMIIKLIGLGFKLYTKDRFNVFDGIIVIISSVEIILSQTSFYDGGSNSSLAVFRGFRMLRLLKLAKQWEGLHDLLTIIGTTLKDIRNFTVLLVIAIFTYTILGLEFFAFRLNYTVPGDKPVPLGTPNSLPPRMNFDTFVTALASIFNILHGEDWQLIMYNSVRSVGPETILFFVLLVILG